MKKVAVIQDFCSDILRYHDILSEEMMYHLSISAGLMENSVTHAGCDVLDWSTRKTAEYILKHITICSENVLDDVFFLLLKMPDTVH
jgi:hypothetical protein